MSRKNGHLVIPIWAHRGLDSAQNFATSTEEIGNPIYPPARRELEQHGVTLYPHFAVQLKKSNYNRYDPFLCMDGINAHNALRIFGDNPQNKVRRLLKDCDVSDPWYTDQFDVAYADIVEGCEALFGGVTEQKRGRGESPCLFP